MELKWLEDFVCLANTGSFWKASIERHISQPAFSRRIRTLEDWLGVELIDRSSYPVTLTPYGRQFMPYAQEMMRASKAIRDEFRQLATARSNEARVATLHAISIHYLPRLVAKMAEQHPESRTIVISSMKGVESHFDALASGLVNILVTYGDPAIVSDIPHMETLEDVLLDNDELVPVASGRFAKKARLKELGRAKEPVPFLAYSEFSFSEKLIAPLVAGLGSRLRVVGESGLSETLKAMALNHMGVAWIPRFSIEMELGRGELVPVGGSDLCAPLMIKAYRSRTSKAEAANQLWNLLAARSRARIALQT